MVPHWLLFLAGVTLLRHSGGGSQVGVGLLALLPCIWMAMDRVLLAVDQEDTSCVDRGHPGDHPRQLAARAVARLRGAVLAVALAALISIAMHDLISDENALGVARKDGIVSVGYAVSNGRETPTAVLARADGARYAEKRCEAADAVAAD